MISFTIQGRPKTTQTGSLIRVGKRMFPKRLHTEWSAYCRLVAQEHAPKTPLEGALRCTLTFYVPRLASGKRAHPIKRPDLDNLSKGLLDSFNGILWQDDAQVCELRLAKCYEVDGYPGLHVCVEELA